MAFAREDNVVPCLWTAWGRPTVAHRLLTPTHLDAPELCEPGDDDGTTEPLLTSVDGQLSTIHSPYCCH